MRRFLALLLAITMVAGSSLPHSTALASYHPENHSAEYSTYADIPEIDLPANPADPTDPVDSDAPTDPANPAAPSLPGTPDQPGEPTQPGNPEDPDSPILPVDPEDPHVHSSEELTVLYPATDKEDGLEIGICDTCGETWENIIYHPADIVLSKTEYTYNKKERNPSFSVYDAAGEKIPANICTAVYSNNAMPGKAKITVGIHSDRYDANIKTSFRIALPAISLNDVKARTEGFHASWDSQTRYISGYQIAYSTDKNFPSEETSRKKIDGKKNDNKIISKLESKTRYYVRIRTYMNTEDKTYYSDWSEAMKVKTLETRRVTMVAVGDDLLHSPVYKSCKTSKGYNFKPMFAHVKKDIKAADLAVINQETILVKSNYTSYPSFGSPFKVADAIADAGFDIVTCATNHTMDRGTSSILDTMDYWAEHFPDVTLLGVHRSQKDADKITVVEKNGIKIAMLNYTYGLNGYRLPKDKSYMIDLLSNKDHIRSQIKQAKKKSDIVIVYAHWGTEYVYSPDSSQKNWAQFFADEGVDLVIGGHPHVLEPIKKVTGKNGNTMICYYSLGNYISAQGKVPRALGGMADITIVKDSDGTRVEKSDMIPLVTHMSNGSRPYTVYKLEDYTDELARANHLRNRTSEAVTVKKFKDLFKYIMSR